MSLWIEDKMVDLYFTSWIIISLKLYCRKNVIRIQENKQNILSVELRKFQNYFIYQITWRIYFSLFKVDGDWGNWGNYGACSKTCGGGTKERTRKCDNPAPAHGGKGCEGSASQSLECNTLKCPSTPGICTLVF